MSTKKVLSEQSSDALGEFVMKYLHNPPEDGIPYVDDFPLSERDREIVCKWFEHYNAQRKRQYYNELYRAAKRFIFSYEVYDLKLS